MPGAGRGKVGRDTPEFFLSYRVDELRQEFSSGHRNVHIEERPPGKLFSSIQTKYSCVGVQTSVSKVPVQFQRSALLFVRAKAPGWNRFQRGFHQLLE